MSILGDRASFALKNLEAYHEPPVQRYGPETEVDAVLALADGHGFPDFELVGYSAGGTVALAVVAAAPERVRTLTVIEPALIGNDAFAAEETTYLAAMDEIMALPPSRERICRFARAVLADGCAVT